MSIPTPHAGQAFSKEHGLGRRRTLPGFYLPNRHPALMQTALLAIFLIVNITSVPCEARRAESAQKAQASAAAVAPMPPQCPGSALTSHGGGCLLPDLWRSWRYVALTCQRRARPASDHLSPKNPRLFRRVLAARPVAVLAQFCVDLPTPGPASFRPSKPENPPAISPVD